MTTPRDTDRENFVKAGLIHPPVVTYPIGQSGKRSMWRPDADSRQGIIREYLDRDSRYTYQHAANELTLLGYDPVNPELVRNFLIQYAMGWNRLCSLALQRYHSLADGTPEAIRAALRRRSHAAAKLVGLPEESLDEQRRRPNDEHSSEEILNLIAALSHGVAPDAVTKKSLADGQEYLPTFAHIATDQLQSGFVVFGQLIERLSDRGCITVKPSCKLYRMQEYT